MTTARDIVKKSLQKLGVLVKSEAPSADEAADGLDALNAMVSAWANDSMTCFVRTYENFPLVAGTSSYTIGSGQTFNTTRPVYIPESHIRINNTDYALTLIDDETYEGLSNKTTQGIPQFINFTNGYPTATIKLYPVPASNYTLYLTTEKPLSAFTLDSTISLPPGWERALIYNLSVEEAPEYGEAVDDATFARVSVVARDSKANIMRAIMKTRSMDAPFPVRATGKRSNYDGY